MFFVFFYKLRSFEKKDLPFLESILQNMVIDTKILNIVTKNEKLYIELQKAFIIRQVLNKEYVKKLWKKKELISSILKEYKYDFFSCFSDCEEKHNRLLKFKK